MMSAYKVSGAAQLTVEKNVSIALKKPSKKDFLAQVRLHSTSCFMLLLILLNVSSCFSQSGTENQRYEFNMDKCKNLNCEFHLIAVDERDHGSGQLFLGASNHLFQLSHDLKFIKKVVTGPSEGSNVIAKILLIDERNQRIIVCYNVRHGTCELRSLADISDVRNGFNSTKMSTQQYVAAPGDLSTIAFISTLPKDGSQYLYVGSSKTSQDVVDEQGEVVLTVSRRLLFDNDRDPDMFSSRLFQEGLLIGEMGLEMKQAKYARRNFRVTFLDGFTSKNTGFFVITHPVTVNDEPSFLRNFTFVSQLCLGSNPSGLLRSYLELQIECKLNGVTHGTAITSKTARVGRSLAAQLGIPVGKSNDVLFVSFKDRSRQDGSVICLYPIHQIEEKFVSVVSNCMKGSGGTAKQIQWLKRKIPSCGKAVSTIYLKPVECSKIWH